MAFYEHRLKVRPFVAAAAFLTPQFTSNASPAPSTALGKGLFEQSGSNSCMFCHGRTGRDGVVKAAAKLDEPRTWKSFRATNGDREKMLAALRALVRDGTLVFNAAYQAPGFDWSRIEKYHPEMLGLTGGPSQAWLERRAPEGITPDIAAASVLLHIRALDRSDFWK